MNIYHTRERLRTRSIYDLNLRVAFYARVSTDSEDQQVSIEHQTQYYKEFIKSNRNWKFAKGYIDNGISGIQTKHREQFKEMLEDAKNGKFDMLITKEITRFARNTLDSIQYTRQMLSWGVCVWFQNDNINTVILSNSREGSIQFFQNRRIQSIQRLRVINFNRANIILFLDN